MKLGIYCPDWLLAWHNTDHKVMKMFSRMSEFSTMETSFVAARSYTMTFNINKIANRFFPVKTSIERHGLRKQGGNVDIIYHYGSPVNPNKFYNTVNNLPVFVTTGFMTDHFVNSLFGRTVNRQNEADALAKTLDQADRIHFHTLGGLRRFIQYRPEFKEKAINIPFFLPDLQINNSSAIEVYQAPAGVEILFVGSDGERKGLVELINALDILGKAYLQSYGVKVTIVSKKKPAPSCGFDLSWFKYLPHNQILKLMQRAPIFVLVPKMESYGLVLVEAMCNRCSIIADNDETRQEILDDTGLLITPGSSTLLAEKLRILIENRALREDLGNRAQMRASALFTPEIVAKQYSASFQSVIKNEI
ncbi:glycosyltransferase family 4 protein [Pedobacter sp.]|uniref:glycosyltransferase family 4 protein n=1 Tax=Pedobacter sp. TaxID=1411316 RepID=UPI003D7F807C